MNREILFRAWYKTKKKMVFFPDLNSCWIASNGIIGIDTDLKSDTYIEHENEWWKNMSLLTQYTGLKDKNGKEIYEGDILHYDSEKIAGYTKVVVEENLEVRFQDGAFTTKLELLGNGLRRRNMYVIGNIYENPELLQTNAFQR